MELTRPVVKERECPTAVIPVRNLYIKEGIFRNYADHAETVSSKLVDFLLIQQIVQSPMQPN